MWLFIRLPNCLTPTGRPYATGRNRKAIACLQVRQALRGRTSHGLVYEPVRDDSRRSQSRRDAGIKPGGESANSWATERRDASPRSGRRFSVPRNLSPYTRALCDTESDQIAGRRVATEAIDGKQS